VSKIKNFNVGDIVRLAWRHSMDEKVSLLVVLEVFDSGIVNVFSLDTNKVLSYDWESLGLAIAYEK
jgi:hypothetical protein